MNRALVLLLLLAGCTSVTLPAEGDGRTRIYFGLVRLTLPSSAGVTAAADVQSLGAGFEQGVWLGYRAEDLIVADPARCQLVVIIRSAAEAVNAARVLQTLKGDNPCVVDETGSLAH